MRALRRFLRTAYYALAWIIIGAGVSFFVLEQSGWIADAMRQRLREELGPLAQDLKLEDLDVHWFEPGVELIGLELGSGEDRVRFDRIHVRMRPSTEPERLLAKLSVHGGELRISDFLLDGLRRLGERQKPMPAERGLTDDLKFLDNLPVIDIRDLSLSLESPSGKTIPLGKVDAHLSSSSRGTRMGGRLRPALARDLPGAEIRIRGEERERGVFEITAFAQDLELDIDALQLPPGEMPPLSKANFRMGLSANALLPLDPMQQAQATFSLSLLDGALAGAGAGPELENVELRLETTYAPRKDDGLWAAEAWTARGTTAAQWGDCSATGTILGGQAAGADDALVAWMSLPNISVESEAMDRLRLDGQAKFTLDNIWAALEPRGAVDAHIGLRIPSPPSPDADYSTVMPDVLIDVRPGGKAHVSYHGFPDEAGRRYGVPLPISAVDGQVVFNLNQASAVESRLILAEMSGDHGSGPVYGNGLFVPPARVGDPINFELAIEVPVLEINDALGEALKGMPATAGIFPEYSPEGGQVSASWRIHSSALTKGVVATGDVRFEADRMRWSELPVPLLNVEGEFHLRFSPHASFAADGSREFPIYRAAGLVFLAEGDLSTNGRAKVDIRYRGSRLADRIEFKDIPKSGRGSYAVDIDGLSLRGSDWQILSDNVEGLEQRAQELGWKGTANVKYRNRIAGPGAPFKMELSATPGDMEIQPEAFPARTRELRGRFLSRGVQTNHIEREALRKPYPELDLDLPPVVYASTTRFCMSGRWNDEIVIVGAGQFPPEGGGRMQIIGAGIDPSNRSLLGSLQRAITGGGPGSLDLSTQKISGLLDFRADLGFLPDPKAEAQVDFRVYMRNTDFSVGDFALSNMRGVLVRENEILHGTNIRAELASTPIELRELFFLDPKDLDRLPYTDSLILGEGFLPDSEGFLLQTEIFARDMPLDREHLQNFLDEATLEALVDGAGLRGSIDLGSQTASLDPERGAHVLLHMDRNGNTKLGFHGSIVPQSVDVRLGLPVHLSSGRLVIQSLILQSGGLRAWGLLRDLYGRVAGRSLSIERATLSLVESRFSLERLYGELEGGSFSSLGGRDKGATAIAVDLREPYNFTTALEIGNPVRADAQGLLKGLFDSAVADKGKVAGWMRLRGTPGDFKGMRGTGEISFSEARLWSIPAMRELFSQLGFDGSALFDRMRTKLAVENGRIYMRDMYAHSPILLLVGEGSVGLDGSLSHDLEVQYSLINKLGIFARFVYWIQNSLLSVSIRGDMARPKIILRNSILDIFRRTGELRRALPLPEFTPLPQRF